MRDTIRRFLEGIASGKDQRALRAVIDPIGDLMSSQPLTTLGLVIKTGGSTLAKSGAADAYAVAKGKLVKVAASTDMPALTGITITANRFNVVCFAIDYAGVVTALQGTEATTIANIVFPQIPTGKAVIGFLLITHSSTFTGGTTPLDTATTVYISPLGPCDPTILVS